MNKQDKLQALEQFRKTFWDHSEYELSLFYTLMKKEALIDIAVAMHLQVSSMQKGLERIR